jgi:hypothetical protein
MFRARFYVCLALVCLLYLGSCTHAYKQEAFKRIFSIDSIKMLIQGNWRNNKDSTDFFRISSDTFYRKDSSSIMPCVYKIRKFDSADLRFYKKKYGFLITVTNLYPDTVSNEMGNRVLTTSTVYLPIDSINTKKIKIGDTWYVRKSFKQK